MSISTDSAAVRIALLDDDSGLLTVLARRLDALHWTHELLSYAPAPEQLAALRVHALVLNPALTGLEYVEQLAVKAPSVGLLLIAGHGTVADRVRALRGGADDWIAKPVHPEELVARIQAVLRRRRVGAQPDEDVPLSVGELTIRPDRFDAYVGGEPAGLSRKEFELLHQLAAAEGRVLEREVIYQRVWGYMMVRGDRSVDVFVRKLRTKLERLSPGWRYVHTHFGVGYRFAPEPLDPMPAADGVPTVDTVPAPAAATKPAPAAAGQARAVTSGAKTPALV
ncbi:response regulator transcription factor [Conexibacter sp. DBS9H8]|uniref:response regulator transcription factor n=1 Tax=Conexibacter sp. DBS9H8 TaxID=2937801 RepID=UPI00200CE2F1|nr:response regulator transcription factor [Conexibacter sp. DBS9H8]